MLFSEGPEPQCPEVELPSQAVRPRKSARFDKSAYLLQIRLNTFEDTKPDTEVRCKRKKKKICVSEIRVSKTEQIYCEDKKEKKKQRCSGCKEGLGNRLGKVAACRSTTAIDLNA